MRLCLWTARKTEIDEENDLEPYDNGPNLKANTNNTRQLLTQYPKEMLSTSPPQGRKKNVFT